MDECTDKDLFLEATNFKQYRVWYQDELRTREKDLFIIGIKGGIVFFWNPLHSFVEAVPASRILRMEGVDHYDPRDFGCHTGCQTNHSAHKGLSSFDSKNGQEDD